MQSENLSPDSVSRVVIIRIFFFFFLGGMGDDL